MKNIKQNSTLVDLQILLQKKLRPKTLLILKAKLSNSNANGAKDLSNEKILLSGICLQFTASPDIF